MPDVERFDDLVLGGGEAGKYLAWEMAKLGRRTAVVERGLIGGSCPNIACLPSKNVIRSAKVAELNRRAAEFGIETGETSTDMIRVRRHKRDMVDSLIELHRSRFKANGLEFMLGEGRFIVPKTLEVRLNDGGARRVHGERVFVDVGTHATIPDIPGLEATAPLTHVEALELGTLPEHLIVLGGGYVGLELAHAFRRFGSRVTIVEHGPRLAKREDSDVARALLEIFREDGIDVVLSAQTLRAEGRSGERVRLQLRTSEGQRAVEGSDILVAIGRTPNTHGIGSEAAGIEIDARGYVVVNERLETTAPDVWAMGECAGSPQFTHVAFDDFRVVRDNLAGGTRTTRDRLIPFCVFTDPELARIGLTETEARQQGLAVRIAKLSMTSVLRARAIAETRGFMKAIIDARSDRILGFTMLGAGAGEVVAVVQTAMLAGMPYTGLRDAILTHPTMAEGLTVLLANVPVSASNSKCHIWTHPGLQERIDACDVRSSCGHISGLCGEA